MMRKQYVTTVGLLLLAALATFAAGCSTMSHKGPIDQAAIEANIRAQIATHYPGETFDISIDVTEDGVVTLAGTVNDSDKRTRIGKIARETPGVRKVINDIKVA